MMWTLAALYMIQVPGKALEALLETVQSHNCSGVGGDGQHLSEVPQGILCRRSVDGAVKMRAQHPQKTPEVVHVIGDLCNWCLQGQVGEDLMENLQGFIHGLKALHRKFPRNEIQPIYLQAQWRELH